MSKVALTMICGLSLMACPVAPSSPISGGDAGPADRDGGERALDAGAQQDDAGANECRDDRDCGRNGRCIEGACVSEPPPGSCAGDQDCEPDEVCHPEFERCVPNPEQNTCQADEDCEPGWRCHEGSCIPENARPCGDQGCQAPLVCDEILNICRPPACQADEDCPEG